MTRLALVVAVLAILLPGAHAVVEVAVPVPRAPVLPETPVGARVLVGDDPGREAVVTWASGAPRGDVRLTDALGGERRVAAETAPWPESRYRSNVAGVYRSQTEVAGQLYQHVARLDRLTVGSSYTYDVGDATTRSGILSFATAPRQPEAFTFTAYGDSHPGPVARLVSERAAAAAPAFHLQLGDVSYAGTLRAGMEAWYDAWSTEQTVMSVAPYMPAMGNHDRDQVNSSWWYHGRVWPMEYAGPASWTFRWGDLAVVSLWHDSEHSPLSPAVYAFADDALARWDAEGVRWTVVTLHAGPYSTGNHGSACLARGTLAPLFAEHGVDLVLSGHDHSYERSTPVDGTTYIVAGTGGAELYPLSEPPLDPCGDPSWSAARQMRWGHVEVDVSKDALTGRFVDAETGGALDTFVIH